MSKIFEDFHIHGVPDTDETCVLAAILTGEPVLLIGPPGTAKTEIIYMLGSTLRESSKRKFPDQPENWFKFVVYDTSKINFEDLIGWPNPNALKEGKVAFIQSPTTIWDKDLIGLDELNRCAEDRQANLFEVIRNRTCMGAPTRVKFIISAINPFGDVGTNNLSSAIVDRHLYFIQFEPFSKMEGNLRKKVIERIGTVDSVGLKHWTNTASVLDATQDWDNSGAVVINNYLADQGDRLLSVISEAAIAYKSICEDLTQPVSNLVDMIVGKLSSDKDAKSMPQISGRRAGMMARSIFAYRAVQLARSKILNTPLESMRNTAYYSLMASIPIGIDKPATPDVFTKVKQVIGDTCSHWEKTLEGNGGNNNVIYDIYYAQDPMKKLELLLQNPNLNSFAISKTWKELADKDQDMSCILLMLSKALPDAIPSHVISADKQKELEAYMEKESMSLPLTPIMEPFQKEIEALLSDKKYSVVYACALFSVKKMIKTCVTIEEVQIAVKMTEHLQKRCIELIYQKNSEVANNVTSGVKKPNK